MVDGPSRINAPSPKKGEAPRTDFEVPSRDDPPFRDKSEVNGNGDEPYMTEEKK